MANQRAQGQELVTVWMDSSLVSAIDQGCRKLRGVARSQFIRDAIQERLSSVGIFVTDEIVVPPARTQPRRQKSAQIKPGDHNAPGFLKQLAGAHPLRSEVRVPSPKAALPSDSKSAPHPPASPRPSSPPPAPAPVLK